MVNKINYDKELQNMIDKLKPGEAPRLLLHACCAPCSSYVLEYLNRYFTITFLFYNPNISPSQEYQRREEELRRLVSEMPLVNPVDFAYCAYMPQAFLEAVKGLETEPEGGERCKHCYRLRLTEAAKKAVELRCAYFTSTLSISPMKSSQVLNRIGEEVGKEYGVRYLPCDFKKRGGYQRSIVLSREYQLYRQDYCGCVFSRAARMRQQEQQSAREKK